MAIRDGANVTRRRVLASIIIQACCVVTQLLVGVIMARVLSVDGRGRVITALLIVGIALAALTAGLYPSLSRAAGSQTPLGRPLLFILLGVALSAALACQAGAVAVGLAHGWRWEFLALGPLGLMGGASAAVCAGAGRLIWSALIAWAPSLTALTMLGVALWYGFSLNDETMLRYYVLGNAVGLLLSIPGWMLIAGGLAQGRPGSTENFRAFLGQAAWLHPAVFAQLLSLRLDVLLLSIIKGPGEVSIYNAAMSFASPLQLPLLALKGRVIGTALAIVQHPRRVLKLSAAWIAAGAIGLACSLPLVTVVFGDAYAAARPLAAGLLLAGSFLYGRDLLAAVLMGHGRGRQVAVTEAIVLGVAAPVYLGSVYAWGSAGAVIASCSVYAVGCAMYLKQLQNIRSNEIVTDQEEAKSH